MIRRLIPALATLSLAACSPQVADEVAELDHFNYQQFEITIAVPGDYATISDALANAVPTDIVSVGTGTWFEDLVIPGGVILQGAGIYSTQIAGTITVSGGEAGVVSLSVIGQGPAANNDCGISVGPGDGIEVVSVSVSQWYAGICLDSGNGLPFNDPFVDRASLSNNGYGVLVQSGHADVTNSYFAYSIRSGVWAFDSASANVVNNTFLGNSFGGNVVDRDAAISLGVSGGNVVHNNNVVSNFYGVQCDGCTGDWSHNNVWGNTTNYAGEASNSGSDLSVDPLFVSVNANNLRLASVSPLIDAGDLTFAPAHDWDGLARPSGDGVDIGADEWTLTDYTLVINEVMANPAVESTGEYVEILNVGQEPQELDGIILSDGDAEDVVSGYQGGPTELAPGGIAIILDPGYAGQYAIPVDALLLEVSNATLGNGLSTTDPISLIEPNGYVTIDAWTIPYNPGDSVSVERIDATLGNIASNWVDSTCPSGNSAGAPNCAAGNGSDNDPSVLVITEIMANPLDEQSGEYIEIWNSGAEAVDLAELWIRDVNLNTGSDSTDALQPFAGSDTVLPPGGIALILDPGNENQYREPIVSILMTTGDATLGNALSAANDGVELWDGDPDAGGVLIDSFSFPSDEGDGISIEKIDYAGGDVANNWSASGCAAGHSSGRLNCAAGGIGADLVINEVMNNPLNEQTGEFIELKNIGSIDLDIGSLMITDGDQIDALVPYDGSPSLVPAGGFALIVDSGYAGNFDIPVDTVVMTTADAHIGNGLSVSDPVTLLEWDGVNPIDTWINPINPGNGTSVEKVNEYVGDYTSNWEAATGCASGSSPGLANCSSYSPIPSGTTDLYISEVMSNPLDEGTGEFIEVYNYGSTPIDLWGLIVYDGDAWDFIREFGSGSTVVNPGEYAVIVDLQYAGQYGISGVTVVTVDDGAIGSGLATNDPVALYEPDGYSIIDSYTFPFNAGNGTSVERIVLEDGDTEDNWVASSCGNSVGVLNCGP